MHKCTLHTAKPFVNCGKFKSRDRKGEKISEGFHTVRKSRNMNKAKQVSNFLIIGAAIFIVKHNGKRIKILQGCPFEG
jgi:hypothetical protein